MILQYLLEKSNFYFIQSYFITHSGITRRQRPRGKTDHVQGMSEI